MPKKTAAKKGASAEARQLKKAQANLAKIRKLATQILKATGKSTDTPPPASEF